MSTLFQDITLVFILLALIICIVSVYNLTIAIRNLDVKAMAMALMINNLPNSKVYKPSIIVANTDEILVEIEKILGKKKEDNNKDYRNVMGMKGEEE